MSETMIERVARAIYGDSFPEWKDIDAAPRTKAIFVDMALAAIDAMREPTDEMINAAVEATSEQVDWVSGLFGGSYDNATQVFSDAHTAAIDAALKEQTK